MCLPCTAGVYCSQPNQTTFTSQCQSGFYCPMGQNIPNPAGFPCPVGSRCPTGSPAPEYCPAGAYPRCYAIIHVRPSNSMCSTGYYQDQVGQPSCKTCPAGYYCPLNTSTPIDCPQGSYCPSNTGAPRTYLCPSGSYGNMTNLQSEAQCSQCDPGKFCSGLGLTAPVANCTAGYYCRLGANVSAPTDGITGNVCPADIVCRVQEHASARQARLLATGNTGTFRSLLVRSCFRCFIVALSDCPASRGKYCAASASLAEYRAIAMVSSAQRFGYLIPTTTKDISAALAASVPMAQRQSWCVSPQLTTRTLVLRPVAHARAVRTVRPPT